MIDRNYFKEIGLEDSADKYTEKFAGDELVETTITVHLPKRALEALKDAIEREII
jgi:hypothetical protein